jgi:hypothetical protein
MSSGVAGLPCAGTYRQGLLPPASMALLLVGVAAADAGPLKAPGMPPPTLLVVL